MAKWIQLCVDSKDLDGKKALLGSFSKYFPNYVISFQLIWQLL